MDSHRLKRRVSVGMTHFSINKITVISLVIFVPTMSEFIIDFETTGLGPDSSDPIEVALTHVVSGETWSTLIKLNTVAAIPPFVRALTGINEDMLADQGLTTNLALDAFFAFVAKHISPCTRDFVLIAHNAKFDRAFFERFAGKRADEYHITWICTLAMARSLLKDDLKSFKLGEVCDFFYIPNLDSHRAAGDTIATRQLLLCLRAWPATPEEVQIANELHDI